MSKLEEIGFYTLSDNRAANSSLTSPLWRCELILTDRCNFKCPYCRGLKYGNGDLQFSDAKLIIEKWLSHNLQNVRFSGGEPTLHSDLVHLVKICRDAGTGRIAISTNGSADLAFYKELIEAGVNDFSISLDACCSSTAEKMNGGRHTWEKLLANIKALSELTYVTVGIVLTEDNMAEIWETIELAANLGVSDIRVIPAAQHDSFLKTCATPTSLHHHKILAYRWANLVGNRPVRGLGPENNNRCPLVLDDMAVAGTDHFPCIIYLREGGQPIGSMMEDMSTVRWERQLWAKNHNTHKDPICRKNCLDVCVDYNDRFRDFH